MPNESILKRITNRFATPKRVPQSTELGGTGTTIFSGQIDTGEYVADLIGDKLIDTVNQMRWSDASVHMALQVVNLPLLSAEWDITAASEESADDEVAEFVKHNLFEILPWNDNLRQALLMLAYGHFAFELVYGFEDNKIVCTKWAPRLPKTIVSWNTEKGELKSITQRFYQDNLYKNVEIPIEKLMVLVHQKEGDNWKGTSILRQAYKHWFFRDKYYKIDAIATERHGVGIPVITLPEGYTAQDKTEAEELGKNLRSNEQAYVIRPSDKWMIEMLDMKASTIKDPKEMLDHHTREILKSVLAQFVELGSTSTGSYALSTDQSSFFLNAIDSIAKNIEDTIYHQFIVPLVDLNFTVTDYPKLTHGDLGSTQVDILANAVQTLTLAGALTPDLEMEDYLRTVLKLPEMSDEQREMKEKENEAQHERTINPPPNPFYQNGDSEQPSGNPENPQDAGAIDEDLKKKKEEQPAKMHEGKWHRDLTKAESRVRFEEIDSYMRTEEAKLYKELSKILLKERAYLLPIFEKAVRDQDIASLQRIAGRFSGEYERVFRNGIKKIFEFGKNKASFELKKTVPYTTPEIETKLYDKAHFYAQKGYQDLLSSLTAPAVLAMTNQAVTEREAVAKLHDAFKSFVNKNAYTASNLVISENINEGRKYVFNKYAEDIYAYQWSSILDGGTCNYCRSMDGKTISAVDRSFSAYQPGRVHFLCRCIWVAVLKDDYPLPAYTGIPDSLKPQTEVPPWDFEDASAPLPGSSSLNIDERLYAPAGAGTPVSYGQDVFSEKHAEGDVQWIIRGGQHIPLVDGEDISALKEHLSMLKDKFSKTRMPSQNWRN